jgi:tetratricopeptide (TPR) repeat protein
MRFAVALALSALIPGLLPASVAGQSLASPSTRREAFAHYRTGQNLLSSERWDQAAAAFQAAIKLDPLFVDAHYGLGQAYMGATRYASAVQAYTRCLEAARAIHGLRDRDRVAVDRQIDEEIRELRDAARRVASQANPQAVAMKVLQIEQRIQDRERSRSSNMGAFEPPAGVLLALGSAHFRSGARDEAESHWTAAVQRDPAIGEAWNNLAVVYLQSARKAEAEDAVKRAERAGFRVNPRLKDDIKRMPAP